MKSPGIIVAMASQIMGDVYAAAFSGCFEHCTVLPATDHQKAKAEIEKRDILLILTEAKVGDTSYTELFKSEKILGSFTLVCVLGDSAGNPPAGCKSKFLFFPPSVPIKELIANVDSELSASWPRVEYCQIALDSLLMRNLECRYDLYLKMSGDKFLKAVNAEDLFDTNQFERFQKKGIEHLYLARHDFLQMIDKMKAEIDRLNADSANIKLDESVAATQKIFQTIHTAVEVDGFSPQLQRLAEATVHLAINTVRNNPKLGEILERIEKDKGSFIGWHSTALAFLSCKLATVMGWQSQATFYKLSLAAMLHDISLPNEKLAEIQSKVEVESLSADDRALVLGHPVASAKLVTSFPEVPGEVAFILEQHHERQDGSGFPRGADHKDISAVSALFIIGHDIVRAMYQMKDTPFDLEGFLSQREAEKLYTKGAFGQVFRAIVSNLRSSV